MDGIVAATARAINLLGDAALRSSANDLLRLARSAARAAVDAGVDAPRNELLLSAKKLYLSLEGSTGLSDAVADLRRAAADLEGALGAELSTVRDAAAKLASACRDHQEAVKKMEEARVSEAGRERGPRHARWWSRIGGSGQRRGVEDDDGRAPLLVEGREQTTIAIEFLADGVANAQQLKDSACSLISVARRRVVRDDEIAQIVDTLEKAVNSSEEGGISSSEFVISIGKAAADIEAELGASIGVVRGPATNLLRACQKHQDGAEAMAAVLRAAKEQAPREENIAAVQQQNGTPDGDLPSSQAMDRMSDMRINALVGSLALLPYLGSDGVLKSSSFDDDYRKLVCRWFSICWILVGLGMSCIPARSRFLRHYAQLSSRLGMIGITIFMIVFCHWLLDPTTEAMPRGLISTAVSLHIFVFFWSLIEGDF